MGLLHLGVSGEVLVSHESLEVCRLSKSSRLAAEQTEAPAMIPLGSIERRQAVGVAAS